jgi:hypothetical protein
MGEYIYMARTVLFFNCFITYNGQYTKLPLEKFLDQVRALDQDKRFRNLPRNGAQSMLGMAPPDSKKNPRFRKITIGKYRDNKPYEGQKGKDIATLIKNDVIELTSMLFVPESYLACIEYNHHGPRVNNIEAYLSSFLPYTEDHKWKVVMIPIATTIGFSDIKASNDIRNIDFKLNLTSNTRGQFENKKNKTILEDLFSKVVKAKDDFGANSSTINFGNGRKRKKEEMIQAKKLIELIELIDTQDDIYESIRVTFIHKGRSISLDLKNEGILKRTIMENNNGSGWEYISDKIEEDFTNGRPGSTKWTSYSKEMIDIKMPDIVKNLKSK